MRTIVIILMHVIGWLWILDNWGESEVLLAALFFGLAVLINESGRD